jgi:hypothetical protein
MSSICYFVTCFHLVARYLPLATQVVSHLAKSAGMSAQAKLLEVVAKTDMTSPPLANFARLRTEHD